MSLDGVVQQTSVWVLVDLPVTDSWELLQDFSLAHHYVPGLTDTQIVSTQKTGEGAHRRVYSGKRFLEETITRWHPGAGFVIRLHKGERPMPPFRSADFEYAINASGSRQTRVDLSMRIIMPGGAAGRFVAAKLIMPVIRKNLTQVAAGLKHFYETGEPAGDEDRSRLAGAVRVAPAGG